MARARLPVNRAAVQRRVASLVTRRSVKGDQQAAWLLRAVTCIDLTTLGGDDTPGTVQRLCAKARQPVRDDILEKLGAQNLKIRALPSRQPLPGILQLAASEWRETPVRDASPSLNASLTSPLPPRGPGTGAVCVYPDRVAEAKLFLKGSGIPVASVATGYGRSYGKRVEIQNL